MQFKKILMGSILMFLMSMGLFNGVYAAPIEEAIAKGDLEGVRNLIAADEAIVNKRQPCGCTPLIDAAFWGRVEIAELLLESGANVDDTNETGQSATMIAISRNHPEVAETIMNAQKRPTKSARNVAP